MYNSSVAKLSPVINCLPFIISLILLGVLVVGMFTQPKDKLYTIPKCSEDAVLVGQGHFEDNDNSGLGQWTIYVCGPAAGDYK